MPAIEICALHQTAVLWPFAGYDKYGTPVVDAAEELSPDDNNGVRWEYAKRTIVGSDGAPISADAEVFLAQFVEQGSAMRLGTLAALPDPVNNQFEVVGYDNVPDIKNRDIFQSAMLRRLDHAPLVSGTVVTPGGRLKYSETITFDGTLKTVTHNLGTQDIIVSLRRVSDDKLLDQSQFNIVSLTSTSITISSSLTSGSYVVTVFG